MRLPFLRTGVSRSLRLMSQQAADVPILASAKLVLFIVQNTSAAP
jgi:hypothetical protein